jgi:hypothetical protein
MPPGDDRFALGYWQKFLGAFTQHLRDLYSSSYSQKVAGIEIWSEENGATYWSTLAGPDPARYSRVLCSAFRGVRSADPSLHVIFGGLAYQKATVRGNTFTIPDFLSRAYGTIFSGTDIRNCMDELGLHPQGVPEAETTPPDDPNGPFQRGLGQLRTVARDHADSGRHIAITEFGYFLGPITAVQQASWDVQSYNLVLQSSDVDLEVINSLFDIRLPSGAVLQQGVASGPSYLRPAALALQQFSKYLTLRPAG